MSKFFGILIAFLVFSFIVFIHELGHYIFAKIGKIKVEEFAIGMGPKLFAFTKGETLYSIRLLPIGGYCQMLGEDEDLEDEHAFNSRPLKARILTILAGPIFNFILAFIFSLLSLLIANHISDTRVVDVIEDLPAYESGLVEGDLITRVNDKNVNFAREASTYIAIEGDKPIKVDYKRNDEEKSLIIEPKKIEDQDRYMVGIVFGNRQIGFFDSFKYAILDTLSWIKMTYYSLGALIGGSVGIDQLSGPVGIISHMSDAYVESTSYGILTVILNIFNIIILLSANLGVMNLLPIPALDGGRLVFLIIEAVRGKPVNQKTEGYFHFAGFVLLMLLMLVVVFNDIFKLL